MTMKHQWKNDNLASGKMAERKDMLILAQQKLDDIHRCNIGLSRRRPGSSSSSHRRKSAMSNHLLSSLLYVALMSYKVEDMKAMLQEDDGDTFFEWKVLLDSLHSPEFYAKERAIQNKRVKNTFDRKRKYKQLVSGLQEELTQTCHKLSELQRISNETSQHMSRAINVLQNERTALVTKGEEKQNRIDVLKEKIHELTVQLKELESEAKRKGETIQCLNQRLDEKEASIQDMEARSSRLSHELALANHTVSNQSDALRDLNSRLEKSESNFAAYKSDTESFTRRLQQDLRESDARHAAVHAELALSKESLDAARKDSDASRNSMESKLDAFDAESKSLLAHIIEALSTLDTKLSCTESLVKAANEHQSEANNLTSTWMKKNQVLEKIVEGNDTLQSSMSRLSIQSGQLEQSFSTVQQRLDTVLVESKIAAAQNMTLTKEYCSKLESRSDLIKESLSGVQRILIDLKKESSDSAAKNATIANEALSRLETRSFCIEEILSSVQKCFTGAIEEGNKSTAKSATIANEALSRLENRSCLIDESLTRIQELLNCLLEEIKSNAERNTSTSNEGFSMLERKSYHVAEVLTSVQELLSNMFGESSSSAAMHASIVNEAFSRLESRSFSNEGALNNSQERLANDECNGTAANTVIANESCARLQIIETTASLQSHFTAGLAEISNSAEEITTITKEAFARVEGRTDQIRKTLTGVQELLTTCLDESNRCPERKILIASEAFSGLEARTNQIKGVQELLSEALAGKQTNLGASTVKESQSSHDSIAPTTNHKTEESYIGDVQDSHLVTSSFSDGESKSKESTRCVDEAVSLSSRDAFSTKYEPMNKEEDSLELQSPSENSASRLAANDLVENFVSEAVAVVSH